MHPLQCQKLETYIQIRRTIYFRPLRVFRMLQGSLFQTKLHLLGTVLLSGFQNSPGALRSTE